VVVEENLLGLLGEGSIQYHVLRELLHG
jgi:hypothetical protein